MKWLNLVEYLLPRKTPRRQARRAARRTPSRFRPLLEALETRLAPANVDVLTWHNDNTLSGLNNQETILTPANVNSANFGKLFTYPVDGYVYAQPLYKANLSIAGGTHNVTFIATEHDSVYAFDADSNTAGPTGNGLYWQRSLIIPRAGFTVTTMPSGDTGSGDIVPEVGITGTPVIQATTNTMFVVAKTKEVENATGTQHFITRLHSLDIRTGAVINSVTIGDTTGVDVANDTLIRVTSANTGRVGDTGAPTGPGVAGGELRFNSRRALHRSAVVIAPPDAAHPNGVVYVDFASHGDNGPYRGWVIGYDPTNLQLLQFFTTALDTRGSGIWQSGSPVAIDAFNNLFFATGNGFGVTTASVGGRNLTEAVVSLQTDPVSGQLQLRDWFIPFNWLQLDQVDADLGSGGTLLLPDAVGDINPATGQRRRLMVETGKEGKIYLLDRDDMGRLSSTQAAETARIRDVLVQGVAGVWGSPAFIQDGPNTGLLYYHGSGDWLKAFRITDGRFVRGPREGQSVDRTNNSWGFPGSQPSISSNGATSAIVWEVQNNSFGTPTSQAILHAYNAFNLGQELYRSDAQGMRDQIIGPVKFTVPIITNGHVIVGQNNTVSIFGLFETFPEPPVAITTLMATALSDSQVQLTWTNPPTGRGTRVFRSTSVAGPFTQVALVGSGVSTYTDTGLMSSTEYFYRVVATNSAGDAPPSPTVSVRTRVAGPVLTLVDVCGAQVDLSWTATANDHYDIERSSNNGATYTVVGTRPAGVTTFSDTGLALGTYLYRIRAFSVSPTDFGVSNVVTASVGPGRIDHSTGFTFHDDIRANGAAIFTSGFAQLTPAENDRAGTVFANTRVGIGNFTTTFTFRVHEGTDPRADGLVFIIQSNNAAAIGPGGGGLAYGPDQPNVAADPRGIRNSLAIKFDFFNNAGEGTNSTGLFTDGRSPSVRRAGLPASFPDISVPITGGVDINNQRLKRVVLDYNGTTLTERIEQIDSDTGMVEFSFTTGYNVDIKSIVGSDTAFIGFGAGTGGLNAIQEIQTWTFDSRDSLVDFRASATTSPTAPFTTMFTDCSLVAGAASYLWDFGDGATSTDRNPSHTYTREGQFTVRLTVTDSAGASQFREKVNFIFVGQRGLTGQYYAPRDTFFSGFTATPILTRVDAVIDLTDNGGATDVFSGGVDITPPVPRDNFAVRWTGTIRPRFSETYTFFTITDDGVRLFVNDQLIINNPTDHGPTTDTGMIALTAGAEFSIRMEFYENGGGALARLEWQSASQPRQLVPTDRLDPRPLVGNINFTADNRFSCDVPTLVQFTDTSTVPNVVSRLWSFGDGTTSDEMNPAHLYEQAGTYTVRLTLTEQSGRVRVLERPNFVAIGHIGFKAEYFNLPGGSAVPDNIGFFTNSAPFLTRIDPTIDVIDNTGQVRSGGVVLPGVQLDDFAVRWTGQIQVPANGSWRFRSRTDDGVRVWVNNQLIINNWTLHGPTDDVGFIMLETGIHYDIKYEFFERGGGALAQLFWSGPGLAEQLVPPSAVCPTLQSIALTPPSRMRLLSSGGNGVNLDWIDDSDNETGFVIERSSDNGQSYSVVGQVGANVRTFSDRPTDVGTYIYRVRSINDFGQSIPSGNTLPITIGIANVDKSNGFSVNNDLQANGNASFTGVNPTVARLTPALNGQTGSVFTRNRVPITNFLSVFTFQMHGGSNPRADGMTFTIQNNSPNALGAGGGSLGYQNIGNSIAVKFDNFDGGTADPTDSTTGLFLNGQGPFGGLSTLDAGVDFRTDRIFQADLGYDGATLELRVIDLTSGATFSTSFTIDIANVIGSDTAFVGFTAATGGLNANHDIRTWSFQSLHAPRGVSNLRMTDRTSSSVSLAWNDNSWNEDGFQIERSSDGVNFQIIGVVGPDVTTFVDTTSDRGTYRVKSFNAYGFGTPNNIVAGPATLNFSGGFAGATGLASNGAAAIVGSVARLTPAVGGAAGSIFSTNRVGIRNFNSTFTFRNHGGTAPPADGLTFTIQGASPNALGQLGTGLGYGQENPGAPLGIPTSVAIKFDLFQGFMDPSPSTTGVYTNGAGPFGGVDTLPFGIDFRSDDVFRVDVSYDGVTLRWVITNTRTSATMVQTQAIDIAAIVGNSTAFVGFTAGTGGLAVNHDVQTWRFDSL